MSLQVTRPSERLTTTHTRACQSFEVKHPPVAEILAVQPFCFSSSNLTRFPYLTRSTASCGLICAQLRFSLLSACYIGRLYQRSSPFRSSLVAKVARTFRVQIFASISFVTRHCRQADAYPSFAACRNHILARPPQLQWSAPPAHTSGFDKCWTSTTSANCCDLASCCKLAPPQLPPAALAAASKPQPPRAT